MIIATAGHVDHGKSTLVQRLTGTDPDRWAEEHRRGLTIDLGFAWTMLPSGRTVGFVDVPGHRRFVANTVAGCGALDGVLLAVSAREGWKPQTEEHVGLLHLLGAPLGVVALTFADLVDAATLDHKCGEVAERLTGTFLEGAPVVPTSADDPASIQRLRATLDTVVTATPTENDCGRPRLWIDRSFLLDGVGRVVTGTLTGGRLAPGERLTATDGTRAAGVRVRSVHTYGVPAAEARPGSRVALGLRVDGDPPARGAAVVHERQWAIGRHLHVSLHPVRGATPPRARGDYTAFVGTWSAPARLSYATTPALGDGWDGTGPVPGPGAVRLARLHLGRDGGPFAIGDRVLLRDAGRGTTVAGGTVLAVDPTVVRRPADALAARLAATEAPPSRRPARIAAAMLAEAGGVAAADLVETHTGRARPTGTRRFGDRVVAISDLRAARGTLARHLAALGRLDLTDDGIERLAARSLVERRLAVERDGSLHDPAATVHDLDAEASDHVRGAVQDGRVGRLFTSREAQTATGLTGRDLRRLVDSGALSVVGDYLVTSDDLRDLVACVGSRLAEGPATAGELRDAVGLTRKHAIPLLEALDRLGVTRRIGDRRTLAGHRSPAHPAPRSGGDP